MKKFIVEFIGTFFLILTVGACVVNSTPGVIAPLAIGSALMVMVFAGGHISGAHYNPAVTLAVAIRGRISLLEVPSYLIAQILAAFVAGFAITYLKGNVPSDSTPESSFTLGQMVLSEFLFTFALAYVVLNVATSKANAGNSFYGLAIGFTVMVGAFAVGPISGGYFNPAVATAGLYLGLLPCPHYLAFIATELVAGVAAGFLFKLLNCEDK